MVKPVWNNAQRVNHQNFAKKTHPCAKKNIVPRAVLMKSGLVSVNIARQVNDAHSKTTVNAARPISYLSKIAHSTVKKPIHKNTSFKNSNIDQRVKTFSGKKFNTARPKAVVNAVKGNSFNVVKASACWVWKLKTKVLDHGNPQMDLQDQGVIDSGCSRNMTGNMSYLTDYEEIDGGYVTFGGNPKGGKIIEKLLRMRLVAASSCCGQVLWIQNQLLDYGYNFMHTKIFIDNNRKAKKSVRLMLEKLFGMELELILFWSTVKAKTINGEVQLHALVDGKKIIIIESTVKRDLQLEDAEGVDCLPNSTIFETTTLMGPKTTVWNEFSSTMASSIICFATNQKFDFSKFIFEYVAVHKELGDSLVRVATTASSLEVEQDSSNIKATPNESSSLGTTLGGGLRGNTLRSDEDRLKLNELMELCTNLQNKVLDLEKAKTTQQNEIDSLKRRVKKLEKKRSSRSHKLKRLYKVGGEEVFVVGQNENVIEEVVDVAQVSTAATTVIITTEEITLAQALEALKTSKPKVKGIVFQEPSTTTTITTISSQQSLDNGKGMMIEEHVKPMKKKVQIMLDEEVALKLQVEIDDEERLAREKAKKEKEANIALSEE
ncbi:hypothetical protein Tco_0735127 [Tanacetum coccineum]